jgi:hypothetical protein
VKLRSRAANSMLKRNKWQLNCGSAFLQGD